MQHIREKELNIEDMMLKMDMDQEEAMSSEDRLFAVPVVRQQRPASCPAPTPFLSGPTAPSPFSSPAPPVLLNSHAAPALLSSPAAPPLFSVVGGRMVQCGPAPFPLNGQQLQLQLDQLTSAMTDMIMDDDTMEAPVNPAYALYIQERSAAETAPLPPSPFSQDEKRRDPVYLASMAAHLVPSPPPSPNNNSVEDQQLLLMLQQQQQQHQQLLLQQHQQQQQQLLLLAHTPASSPPQTCCLPPPDGDFLFNNRRAFSKPDLMPVHNQWS